METLFKSLYGHLPEIHFHMSLQKARGRLLANQDKDGNDGPKIHSCSWTVKEKIDFGNGSGWQIQV